MAYRHSKYIVAWRVPPQGFYPLRRRQENRRIQFWEEWLEAGVVVVVVVDHSKGKAWWR
jgi:hypothetical protein